MAFLRTLTPQKSSCFVIMPFGEKPLRDGSLFNWDEHYRRVIEPTVTKVGMIPSRADEIYGATPLMDRVWTGIQEAEIVIADLTGRSPNVLYEVGLAHVIGKRLLLLTMYADDVPADLAEFVQIRYSKDGFELIQLTNDLEKNLFAARKQPAAEMMLVPLLGHHPEPVPATVLSVTERFAIVEAPGNRRGFLDIEDYSWTRKPKRLDTVLVPGQLVNGAFVVDVNGQQKYSLTALEENPWPKLEKEYPVDSTFTGTIVRFPDNIGAFVKMSYGIDGLIPRTFINDHNLYVGGRAKVQVHSIDSANRRVQLRLVEAEATQSAGVPPPWPFQIGQMFEGRIVTVQQDRGFALIRVDDRATGLLPVAKMSAELRERFLASELRQGDYLSVDVIEADASRRRLVFRDRPTTPSPAT